VQHGSVYFDRIWSCKAPVSEENIDAGGPQAVRRVRAADARSRPSEAPHDLVKIDKKAGGLSSAEIRGIAHLGKEPRRSKDGLRGHASFQSFAADEIAFNERNSNSERRRIPRCDQAGRAGPENREIILGRGLGVVPRSRVRVVECHKIFRILR
jgi:hypothetical protein